MWAYHIMFKRKICSFDIAVIKFLHLIVIDFYTLKSVCKKISDERKWLYFYCLSIITTTFIDKVIVLLPICYFWFVCFPFQWCFFPRLIQNAYSVRYKICNRTIKKKHVLGFFNILFITNLLYKNHVSFIRYSFEFLN